MGFVRKHWFGLYSLPRSYWLHGVVLSNIVFLLLAFVFGLIVGASFAGSGIDSDLLANKAMVFAVLFMIPVMVWSQTGIWRSATFYKANPAKTRFWGTLAQVGVVLGYISFLFQLIAVV